MSSGARNSTISGALAFRRFSSDQVVAFNRLQVDEIKKHCVMTARAQGLPESKVIGQYAMRTASIPVVTVAGLSAGYMLGGAVAIEIIFALPGLGRMLVEAVGRRDYPLVEGGVLTISLVLAVLNLAIDIVYAWLDPRIRYQ
ncbi:MAG: ABC transporter permease subunit [Martelella sp.]